MRGASPAQPAPRSGGASPAQPVRLRALALTVFVLLGVAPFARAQDEAAAPPAEGDARPEVVLWHAYRAKEQESLERFVMDVNAREQDFRVKVLAVPYDAFLDKITAAIPRGRGPDLFIAAHDPIGDWAEAGTVSALDDVVDGDLAASMWDGLLPATIYRDHIYGIPVAFKSIALWRNTNLVKDAPKTLSELERAAVAATKDGAYGLAYENRILFFQVPFLLGFGGRVFGDDGRPALADPQNAASLRYAMRLGRDLKVVPQEVSGTLMTSLFNEGKAAFILTGPWSRGEIDPGTKFAVSALPQVDVDGHSGPMTPFLTVEAVMVSGKTEKRELAVRVAKLLAGEEASARRLKEALQPVANRAAWGALDANDISEDDRGFLRAFLAQLPATVPTPNSPVMKALWSPADLAIGESMGQGTDPATTLAAAQTKVDAILHSVDPTGALAAAQASAAKNAAARVAALKSGATAPASGIVAPRPPDAASPGKNALGPFASLLGVVVALLSLWMVVGVRRYGAARLLRDVGANRTAYLYAAPAMAGLLVLVLVPFAFGVGMGFYEHKWGTYTFVGLANYASILSGDNAAGTNFFKTMAMTMLWTGANVFLHVVIGVLLALLLSQARLRFRGLYRVLFIIPWAVPNYITALIWKGMFHPEFGAINQVLGIQGFSWMNQTWSAFLANLATNTWLGFPFMMVTALGGLTAIPKDLYEAAALDGASPMRRFFSITLPLLKPTLLPAIVLGTVWTFNMFNIIYLVSGGAPGGGTDILITEAFRWAFERGQGGAFGYAAAYSTMIFLLLLAYNTAANRVARAASGSSR